jgi:hypothetical protein
MFDNAIYLKSLYNFFIHIIIYNMLFGAPPKKPSKADRKLLSTGQTNIKGTGFTNVTPLAQLDIKPLKIDTKQKKPNLKKLHSYRVGK